tara:strand:- start:1535 stop:1903 length:369 start_codon:yes stop_codon:yes gene_type:complete
MGMLTLVGQYFLNFPEKIMKPLLILLIFLIGYLQYAQNFDEQGGPKLRGIQEEIKEGNLRRGELIKENDALAEEIKDLTDGYAVIEELARSEMGMIKHGEILLRVYPSEKEALKLKINNDRR